DIAVSGGSQHWTYADLRNRADVAAAGFRTLDLEAGERVIVQLTNIPEFLSVSFGLFRAGLVPVFALPAHRRAEISHFARKAEAAAIVVGPADGFDYVTLARDIRGESECLRHVITVGTTAPGCAAFDAFRPDPQLLPDDVGQSTDVALMQISGGTTGLSKLIPRTHADYLYSCRASADICGLDANTVYLGVLPVAHNFPMSSPGIFGTLSAGGRVVLCTSPSPETAFPIIEREGVTMTALVPPLALLWLQAAEKKQVNLNSLAVLQVGGAKLMPETARRVQPTLGCKLQQVFGMAEGLVNYTRLDDSDTTVNETQGRPISPDDELLILDDQGNRVADGVPGHLLVRGPYTIRAYHNEPAANERSFTDDGFYRTGDIVCRRDDGYLVVQGRATDHINRAGEKISAEEVEDHLLAHDNVFDAAVVAVPDAYLGERSCAFVIAEGDKPKSIALKAWIRARGLAEFKVPDQIVFVDSFHTTAVGKISRKELRQALREQLSEPQASDNGAAR
ncbi:MAG: AMP-binding protein, partial [Pseudomonadota bacterium]